MFIIIINLLHYFTVKTIVKYYGQFRVPDLGFNEKWSDIKSPEYKALASEVKITVRRTWYREQARQWLLIQLRQCLTEYITYNLTQTVYIIYKLLLLLLLLLSLSNMHYQYISYNLMSIIIVHLNSGSLSFYCVSLFYGS